MEQTLEMCRWVYNETLAMRKNAWEQEHKHISYYESKRQIPLWKKEHPELSNVYSQVLQDVSMRVDLAFKAFFRRVKSGEKPGHPRFKGKGRYDSFTYPQYGFRLDGNRLHLSKIGDMRVVLHRPVEGMIKPLTIRRSPTGKWYACFSVKYDPSPAPQKETVVGIDVGLESFATLSNGEKIENPRFFRKRELPSGVPLRHGLWLCLPTRKHSRRRRENSQKQRKELLNGKKPKRSSHASTNGSPTDGSILLIRPPGSWWIGLV